MQQYEIVRTGRKACIMRIPGGSSLTFEPGQSHKVYLTSLQRDACQNAAGFEVNLVPPPEPVEPEKVADPEPKPRTRRSKS